MNRRLDVEFHSTGRADLDEGGRLNVRILGAVIFAVVAAALAMTVVSEANLTTEQHLTLFTASQAYP
jgi:hypothetical protein